MPRPRFDKLTPERREEILDVAASEFAARGFEAASLNRILERLGLSKGAAYYYFDGKQDLFAAVVEAAGQKVLDAVDWDRLEGAPDFWLEIDRVLVALSQLFAEDQRLAGLARAVATMGGRASQALSSINEQSETFWERLLAIGRARGAVRDDVPTRLLQHALQGMFQGIDRYDTTAGDERRHGQLASRMAVDFMRRMSESAGTGPRNRTP